MGSKSSAPEYQSASYDSGLWGSSTTDKSGTKYSPTGWMNATMGTIGGNLNNTLSSMLNNDFMKDPNFLRYQQQFSDNMNDLYNTNVLGNLAGRGLMRSSGLQSATNSFNDTMAKNQLNLYDNYYSRLNNNLSNMLNTSNTLYHYMTGINTGSQNQAGNYNQYNLNKAQIDNAGNGNLFGTIANGIGSVAGLAGGIATGNPFAIASGIGNTANTLSGLSGSGSDLYSNLLGATKVGMPTSIF